MRSWAIDKVAKASFFFFILTQEALPDKKTMVTSPATYPNS